MSKTTIMKSIVDKAQNIVSKAANEYEAENYVYYVEMGTHADRMNEHPSMENYCSKCINEAVMDKKRKFFLDRMAEMGKIYEYEKYGFYRQPQYKWDKQRKACGLIIKRVKSKESKDKAVKYLKRQLNKDYPANMKFDYRYTTCGESDDFDTCESCGVIFNQGLLLSDQELDHWENDVSDQDLKEYINNPYHAYQLDKILYDYREDHKYADRIMGLAQRIISVQ